MTGTYTYSIQLSQSFFLGHIIASVLHSNSHKNIPQTKVVGLGGSCPRITREEATPTRNLTEKLSCGCQNTPAHKRVLGSSEIILWLEHATRHITEARQPQRDSRFRTLVRRRASPPPFTVRMRTSTSDAHSRKKTTTSYEAYTTRDIDRKHQVLTPQPNPHLVPAPASSVFVAPRDTSVDYHH